MLQLFGGSWLHRSSGLMPPGQREDWRSSAGDSCCDHQGIGCEAPHRGVLVMKMPRDESPVDSSQQPAASTWSLHDKSSRSALHAGGSPSGCAHELAPFQGECISWSGQIDGRRASLPLRVLPAHTRRRAEFSHDMLPSRPGEDRRKSHPTTRCLAKSRPLWRAPAIDM